MATYGDIRSTLVQVMASCLTAPSHFTWLPMLTYNEWGLLTFSWGKYHRNSFRCHSVQSVWKPPDWKYGYISQKPMSWCCIAYRHFHKTDCSLPSEAIELPLSAKFDFAKLFSDKTEVNRSSDEIWHLDGMPSLIITYLSPKLDSRGTQIFTKLQVRCTSNGNDSICELGPYSLHT